MRTWTGMSVKRERKTGARVVNMYMRADLLHVDAD